jgi:hypothetical protein
MPFFVERHEMILMYRFLSIKLQKKVIAFDRLCVAITDFCLTATLLHNTAQTFSDLKGKIFS